MTFGPAVEVPATSCPFCEAHFDAASPTRNAGRKPKPGDLTLCIRCARVLFFDDTLNPRKPVSGELEAALAENPAFAEHVKTVQSALRKINGRRMNRGPG
jgi:hypothetical protein